MDSSSGICDTGNDGSLLNMRSIYDGYDHHEEPGLFNEHSFTTMVPDHHGGNGVGKEDNSSISSTPPHPPSSSSNINGNTHHPSMLSYNGMIFQSPNSNDILESNINNPNAWINVHSPSLESNTIRIMEEHKNRIFNEQHQVVGNQNIFSMQQQGLGSPIAIQSPTSPQLGKLSSPSSQSSYISVQDNIGHFLNNNQSNSNNNSNGSNNQNNNNNNINGFNNMYTQSTTITSPIIPSSTTTQSPGGFVDIGMKRYLAHVVQNSPAATPMSSPPFETFNVNNNFNFIGSTNQNGFDLFQQQQQQQIHQQQQLHYSQQQQIHYSQQPNQYHHQINQNNSLRSTSMLPPPTASMLMSSMGDDRSSSPTLHSSISSLPLIPASLSSSPSMNPFIDGGGSGSTPNSPSLGGSSRKVSTPRGSRRKPPARNPSTDNIVATQQLSNSGDVPPSKSHLIKSKKSNSFPTLKRQNTGQSNSGSGGDNDENTGTGGVVGGSFSHMIDRSSGLPSVGEDTQENSSSSSDEELDTSIVSSNSNSSNNLLSASGNSTPRSLSGGSRKSKSLRVNVGKNSPSNSPLMFSKSPSHSLLTPTMSGLSLVSSCGSVGSPSLYGSGGMSKLDLHDSSGEIPQTPTSGRTVESFLAQPLFARQLKETFVPPAGTPPLEDAIRTFQAMIESCNQEFRQNIANSLSELSMDAQSSFTSPEYDVPVTTMDYQKKLVNYHIFRLMMQQDPANNSIPVPSFISNMSSTNINNNNMSSPNDDSSLSIGGGDNLTQLMNQQQQQQQYIQQPSTSAFEPLPITGTYTGHGLRDNLDGSHSGGGDDGLVGMNTADDSFLSLGGGGGDDHLSNPLSNSFASSDNSSSGLLNSNNNPSSPLQIPSPMSPPSTTPSTSVRIDLAHKSVSTSSLNFQPHFTTPLPLSQLYNNQNNLNHLNHSNNSHDHNSSSNINNNCNNSNSNSNFDNFKQNGGGAFYLNPYGISNTTQTTSTPPPSYHTMNTHHHQLSIQRHNSSPALTTPSSPLQSPPLSPLVHSPLQSSPSSFVEPNKKDNSKSKRNKK